MGLQNAQPRFGYDDTDNTIFDYLASKSIKVGGEIETVDGRWDSEKLVHLIKTGQAVEGARLEARNKVEQANRDFIDPGFTAEDQEQKRETADQTKARLEAEAAEQRERDEEVRLAAIDQASRDEDEAERARQEEASKQAQESAMQPQEAPKTGE